MYKLLHNSRDLNFDGLFNWFGACFSFAKMSQNLLPFIVKLNIFVCVYKNIEIIFKHNLLKIKF